MGEKRGGGLKVGVGRLRERKRVKRGWDGRRGRGRMMKGGTEKVGVEEAEEE